MVELTFPVCVEQGDADVCISVSDRDARLLRKYCEDEGYDNPEQVEELETVCARLRKKILIGIGEQVEGAENIDLSALRFSFGFPEFEED